MEAKLRYRKEVGSSHYTKRSVRKSRKQIKPKSAESPKPTITIEHPRSPPRIDFIQRNIDAASAAKSRQPLPVPVSRKQCIIDATHELGAIPDYVTERKIAIEIENSIPDEARCPPGKRLLTEEEKIRLVKDLLLQKYNIEQKLAHEPLKMNTLAQLKQHEAMEQRLEEIDTAVEYLKHKYVFVSE